jgi:fibronectin-binding autotransporter adhesin
MEMPDSILYRQPILSNKMPFNMKHIYKSLTGIIIIISCLLNSGIGIAQSTSWTGNSNSNWRTDTNWTNGAPDESKHVIIGDASFTGSNQPELKQGGAGKCKSLTIGNGAKISALTISQGLTIYGNIFIGANGIVNDDKGNLNIEGDWHNSGVYDANNSKRTVYFAGSSQIISGNSVTDFGRLYINAGSFVSLGQDISISDFIDIRGTLNPGDNTVSGNGNITIGSQGVLLVMAATIGGNYTITGSINATQNTSVIDYASSTNNQSIDNTINYRILKISGGTVKSLIGNTTIDQNLFVAAGTLDLLNFTANRTASGGSMVVAAGATLKIGGNNTFPSNYFSKSLATSSTIEYNGANQIVLNENYGNLILSSSSGSVVKTMPTGTLNVAGDLSAYASSGSLSFTASNIINVAGDISLDALSTYNGSNFTHTLNGNWTNNGTYNGCGGTYIFSGSNTTINGSGTNIFGNVIFHGNDIRLQPNTAISVCGNFSTINDGTFTHVPGGTGVVLINGTEKTISGANISFNNLTIEGSGTITTNSTMTIAGNLIAVGSLSASSGTITFSGLNKTISGAGHVQFASYRVTGLLNTVKDISISSNIDIVGSLTATSGEYTINGTSTYSGTANIFDLEIAGSGTLIMSSHSNLGIAGIAVLQAGGIFNPANNTPNTINYNGSGAQAIVFDTYNNLIVSNGGTKTTVGDLTVIRDFTIGTGTTFFGDGHTYTIHRNWINNGTFSPGLSTIQFTSDKEGSITGATTFHNLMVNKTNDIVLNSDIEALNLDMVSGKMTTNSNAVTITSTRTGDGIIIGTIIRTHSFNENTDYAFEGSNNILNFSSITGTINSITVEVTTGPNLSFPSAASIGRIYKITVAGSVTYISRMRLHYEQSEINGNVENAMTIWEDSGSGTWVNQNKTDNDENDNWVELEGLSALNRKWTISEGLIKYSWNGSIDGSWSNMNNWTPAGIPNIHDVVHLGDLFFANQPVLNTANEIKKLYFDSNTSTTLTLTDNAHLLVKGNIDGMWDSDAVHGIDVGSEILSSQGSIILGGGSANRKINLTASTGTINICGSLKMNSEADISFTGPTILNITEDFIYESGNFSPSTSTVKFLGTGAHKIGGVTYYNLEVDKSGGTVIIDAPVNVDNNVNFKNGNVNIQSALSVAGDMDIGANAQVRVPTSDTLRIGGDWIQLGQFLPGSGTTSFNGTGEQTVGTATFNNLVINKAGGTLTFLGDININGDVNLMNGTVELSTYRLSRTTEGGTITLGARTLSRSGGDVLQVSNFGALAADSTSTVELYSSDTRVILPVTYGNLILSNGGANPKIIMGPTYVTGTLTVNNGAMLLNQSNLTLGGDFIMNGSYNSSDGGLILNGKNNIVSGEITLEHVVVHGKYEKQNGSITIDDHIEVTASGEFDVGNNTTTIHGDLTNMGVVRSNGITIFSGNKTQTIRLINAIASSSTGEVYFNGSVSPVFNANMPPQFASVTINNTAPIISTQPWTVYVSMNIASGATWDMNSLSHTIHGNFSNIGTVVGDGKLSFIPYTQVDIDLGSNFNTTGLVEFGGIGRINLTDHGHEFNSIVISNANTAGISPSTDWKVMDDVLITGGAKLNLGSLTHTYSGSITNNGTLNGQLSTVVLNSNDGYGTIIGIGRYNFNNLVFESGTFLDIVSDIDINANLTNNAEYLNMMGQMVSFKGTESSILTGNTTTNFHDLQVNKPGNTLQLLSDATVSDNIFLTDGALELNGHTLTVTNSLAEAISRVNGYVLSENTSFNSKLSWVIGTSNEQHIFPFGSTSGIYIPLVFSLNSGDAGVVSVATYGTGFDNLPLPPSVTGLNDIGGNNNAANAVDRFFLIDLTGESDPDVDVTFTATPGEIGIIETLTAQRWGTYWEFPLPDQTEGPNSVTVSGISQFSPWVITGNNTPLPVELISFTVAQISDLAVLKWETASESDNDYFEIQKSMNGKEFSILGTVEGSGNSNKKVSYSFTDKDLSSGLTYYRLKQMDFDGTTTLSNVILLNAVVNSEGFKIYPNPTKDIINIFSMAEWNNEISLKVSDLFGREVLNKKYPYKKKAENLHLDLYNLSSGTYLLKIQSGTEAFSFRVLKQ